MKKSVYYQANIKKSKVWMVSSTLKYCDGLAFERTIDKKQSKFEFYVSPDLENIFLDLIKIFENESIIFNLKKIN